jgi:hypothetical protein
MVWHELAKEKPPEKGVRWYVTWSPETYISGPGHSYELYGKEQEFPYHDHFFCSYVTHWAYLNEPGTLSPDDLRLLGLLANLNDWMRAGRMGDPHDGMNGTSDWKLWGRVKDELTARFGPEWEKLKGDQDG